MTKTARLPGALSLIAALLIASCTGSEEPANDAGADTAEARAGNMAASQTGEPDYKLGLPTCFGGDPLDVGSWEEPVFERADDRSVFAPGHNTFFKSPDGTGDWMVYNANDGKSDVCDMGRTPRIQKFTWNDDGTPNFGTPVAAGEPLAVPSRDGGE